MNDIALPDWVAGTWKIDPVHSHVGFVIKHMMVSKVRGHFSEFEGTIVTAVEPSESSVTASIAAKSMDTGNEMRDGHLSSADFFDADNHAEISFASTGMRLEDGEWLVDGTLSIRGTARPVTLSMESPIFGPGNTEGSMKAGFSATTQINRNDFGVSYNGPIPGGGMALADKVDIVLDVEADLVVG